MSNFGETLKELRKNANMTQKQLANMLCISKSTVCCYEQDVRFPSSEMLVSIANVFHVSTDYLYGIERERRTLDVTDLTDRDVELLQMMIRCLREVNGKMSYT